MWCRLRHGDTHYTCLSVTPKTNWCQHPRTACMAGSWSCWLLFFCFQRASKGLEKVGSSRASCQHAMKSWLCPWRRRWLQSCTLPASTPTYRTATVRRWHPPTRRPSSKWPRPRPLRQPPPHSKTSTTTTSKLPAGSPPIRRFERGKSTLTRFHLPRMVRVMWTFFFNIISILFNNSLSFQERTDVQ